MKIAKLLATALSITIILLVGSCVGTKSQPARPIADESTPNIQPVLIQRVSHPDKLTFQPLEIIVPKAERQQLKNGMVVFLLEDKELPLINLTLLVRSGAICEPAGKSGLCSLMSRLLRTGGTEKYPVGKLDEILEFKSAGISASTDYEEMRVTASSLSRDTKDILELLKEVVFAPIFPEDKFQYEKSRMIQSIQRQNDEPGSIADRCFRKLIYGTHPLGETLSGSKESVGSLTRNDIVAFYKTYFVPNNMMVAISGDFRKFEMMELLNQTLGAVPASAKLPEFDIKALEPNIPAPAASVNYVPRDQKQTTIRFGLLGVQRLNPDYFSIRLMNAILGGDSASRLYQSVREKRGLAYDVFSFFYMNQTCPGFFMAGTETRTDATHTSVGLIMDEIRRIREEYVEDQELQNTQEAELNRFAFRFDNSQRIAEQSMYLEYIGLPKDYLETYRAKVMAVTKEDIKRVARKYLQPDKMMLLMVGDSANFDPAVWKIQGDNVKPTELK
ncbi:MAG: pitrilysin family protein [Candidatus Brocadiia bacterium]